MDDENWKLLSGVERSKNRKKIPKYLLEEGEPRKPTEIASQIDVHMQHVSRALRKMTEQEDREGLVVCINPDAPHSRRYRLTKTGRKISTKLKDLEK